MQKRISAEFMAKKPRNQKPEMKPAEESGGDDAASRDNAVIKKFEEVHTLEFAIEVALATAGLYFQVIHGLDGGDASGTKKVVCTAVALILISSYKWMVRMAVSRQRASTAGRKSLTVFANQLLRHLLLYAGVGLMAYWVISNFVPVQAWVIGRNLAIWMHLFITATICSIWFAQHYGYRRIKMEKRSGYKARMKSAMTSLYRRADMSLMISGQTLLRFFLVGVILVLGVTEVATPIASPFENSFQSHTGANWLYMLATYFCITWILFMLAIARNNKMVARPTGEPIRGVLFYPSLLDVVFVTATACCLRPLPDDYHLAYILPLIGLWLFSKFYAVCVISLLVVLGIFVIEAAHQSIWVEGRRLWDSPESYLLAAIPKAAFWMLIIGALLSLRWLRSEESKQRKLIDAVADSLPYAIFAKDARKRFVYINDVLFRALNKNTPSGVKSALEIEKRHDYYGRTDADLKMPHAATYQLSDDKVLAGEPVNQLEPNYDHGKAGSPFVFTSKNPYPPGSSLAGDIKLEWIVGTCEQGTPHLIANAVTAAAPYCMTLKTKDHYIVWANRAFLDKDVDVRMLYERWRNRVSPATKSSMEIVKMWLVESFADSNESTFDKVIKVIESKNSAVEFTCGEKLAILLSMNEGRGATDKDLYDESIANKYIIDDINVVRQAETDITNNRDPIEEAVKKSWSTTEKHHFACLKADKDVSVTKIPWLAGPGKSEVKGVAVFFHVL